LDKLQIILIWKCSISRIITSSAVNKVTAMKRLAPDVWAMLDLLLMGDGKASKTNSTVGDDEDQVIIDLESIAAHGDGFNGEAVMTI
jgi:hypothetical protein